MTRLHSTKKTRLTLIIAFVLLSFLFLVSRSFLDSEEDRVEKAVGINSDSNKSGHKAGSKNGNAERVKAGGNTAVKGGNSKASQRTGSGNANKVKATEVERQKAGQGVKDGNPRAKAAPDASKNKEDNEPKRPGQSPDSNTRGGRVPNAGGKFGPPTQPTKNDKNTGGISGGSNSNRINQKVGADSHDEEEDVEIDPKNPHKFLGEVDEMDDDEREKLGNIYDDDEEKIGVAKVNPKTGEIVNGRKSENGKPPTLENKTPLKLPVNTRTLNKLQFRIYSHNVKNGGHDDLVAGEEDWSKRAFQIAASIMFNAQHNTIVTLQEVYKFQMDQIIEILNKFEGDDSKWQYYGVGRIDGELIGEFVPILYKRSDWEMVFSDTIWLNEKNQKMALVGWDAKYLRILSYGTLKHKETGNFINVFNTHLDHVGQHAKSGSSSLIIRKMSELNDWPSFLCGDLNIEPTDSAYHVLADALQDSSKLTTPFNQYGHSKSTVTGFKGEVLNSGGSNIDYIFSPSYTAKINDEDACKSNLKDISNKLSLQLVSWGMLHSKYNGVYMSDHRPLVGDFLLQQKRC